MSLGAVSHPHVFLETAWGSPLTPSGTEDGGSTDHTPEKSWTHKPVVTSGLQGPGQVTGLKDSPFPGSGAQTPATLWLSTEKTSVAYRYYFPRRSDPITDAGKMDNMGS